VLGTRASLEQADLEQDVTRELTNNPRQSVFLVILPNTPQYGKANTQGLEYEDAVEENRNAVVTSFNNLALKNPEIRVVRCGGQFNAATMYSPIRSLAIDFLVILSKKVASTAVALGLGAAGGGVQGSGVKTSKFESFWSNSRLLKQRMLNSPVDCLPRTEFQDWTSEISIYNKGISEEQSKKQHFSGVPLAVEMLGSLLRGCNLSPDDRVQVRDVTPYDSSVARAVLHMNNNAARGSPVLGYIAAAWHQQPASLNKNLEYNILESVRDHIMSNLRAGTLRGPGVRKSTLGAEPVVDTSLRPVLRPENYTVTCPTAGER